MPRRPSPGDITDLLLRLERGDSKAAENLAPLIYGHLHEMAARFFRRERPDHTLQPTALVHEAYLRLLTSKRPAWKNRAHFFAIAARQMRQILVSHARMHCTDKRGGGQQREPLNEELVYAPKRSALLIELDAALTTLSVLDERQAKIVELRYFAGLSVEETAKAMGLSRTTIKSDWSLAKAWLQREIEKPS